MKETYESESLKIVELIDIAIESFTQYPPENFTQEHVNQIVNVYKLFKEEALHPQPDLRNLRTLKSIKNESLTYFQEGYGRTVEHFWKTVQERGLNVARVDPMQKILKKKKISSQNDYDFIIDTLVPAQQKGLLSPAQVQHLNSLLWDYENKKAK